MTADKLSMFIMRRDLEYNWFDDGSDVVLFVDNDDIVAFHNLIKSGSLFDDGGIECRMKDGYFAFVMSDICDHYGIGLEEVFIKDEEE